MNNIYEHVQRAKEVIEHNASPDWVGRRIVMELATAVVEMAEERSANLKAFELTGKALIEEVAYRKKLEAQLATAQKLIEDLRFYPLLESVRKEADQFLKGAEPK